MRGLNGKGISKPRRSIATLPAPGRRLSRRAVWLMAFVTAAALVAAGVYVDPSLTLVGLCAVLLVALWRQYTAVRKERQSFQGRVEEIGEDYEAVIDVLCGALDLRDSMTAAHSKRVSRLAAVVAQQMGLRKEDVRLVEKAAILHDIGKMGINQQLLAKPGELNEDEWMELRRHPELGSHILQQIGALRDAADLALTHHERYDGQGYPRGLKGDEIPIGARIFAVADAYVAMTSNRPYRKLMPHDIAIKEIIRNSLTQFDPEVVHAFLEVEKRGLLPMEGMVKTAEKVTLSAATSEA